ncbi:hypothetical protein GCM10012285_61800 [Streptomyces kronopolitis]|uniref:Uncharacterized protein n=1 Tax=Streptomyces kronopolitis TaxID=1612435 RepID=A0ABQ2JZK7_9ACTN|nr:hypothetical protein GCM10012285_61800 [Streptomyces kronopolitis]
MTAAPAPAPAGPGTPALRQGARRRERLRHPQTRACATGACAAVAALQARDAQSAFVGDYTVDAPGGRLHVRVRPGGEMELTGPAAVIAQGALTLSLAHGLPASGGVEKGA